MKMTAARAKELRKLQHLLREVFLYGTAHDRTKLNTHLELAAKLARMPAKARDAYLNDALLRIAAGNNKPPVRARRAV